MQYPCGAQRVPPRSALTLPLLPEFLDWLRAGRLTLFNQRVPVDAEQWFDLRHETRAQAQDEFQRVVRGNAKAAVLFLK